MLEALELAGDRNTHTEQIWVSGLGFKLGTTGVLCCGSRGALCNYHVCTVCNPYT